MGKPAGSGAAHSRAGVIVKLRVWRGWSVFSGLGFALVAESQWLGGAKQPLPRLVFGNVLLAFDPHDPIKFGLFAPIDNPHRQHGTKSHYQNQPCPNGYRFGVKHGFSLFKNSGKLRRILRVAG